MSESARTNLQGKPWAHQLSQHQSEPWANGSGILILSGVLIVWFGSLAFRYTSDAAFSAAMIWLVGLMFWLLFQIKIGRDHLPEKRAFLFPTIFQALSPTLLTVALAFLQPDFQTAVVSVAKGVSIIELVAIHGLRLAAWGTIVKYQQGQLPRYFYRYASLPDFGFAILAIAAFAGLGLTGYPVPDVLLYAFSIVGAAAFLGAAITMYFGVPGTLISHRWPYVKKGEEAPTLLPFRWPMNLAPAFCGPAFWLAHALLVIKIASV
ncbi:MAG: hypothetical protein AAGA53_17215 [Pseudomonadota bacterium]